LCLTLAACAASHPEPTAAPSADTGGAESTAPPTPATLDRSQGAAIYDRWWKALGIDFEPDDPATPELDGRGGPHGNGTLSDASGQAMPNGGHDYRLKSLFGWDLRGGDGIYGADYQDKPYVLPVNLLTAGWSREQLAARLRDGGQGVPAYGQVLSAEQIDAVVSFVFDMREGRLPRPDQIWQLTKDAPKHYILASGGDPARGARVLATKCVNCHGKDGKRFLIDGEHSLGSHARQKAYEDWLKLIGGQPGTSMGGQLPPGDDGTAHAAMILDVLAALCDRQAFPAGEPAAGDAPDGDPRCGAYLK
jgi:mono/diheme cytochrome c family protein